MDEAVKSKWLEALRSGQYRQGRGALRDNQDGFCCLGVLCDIIDKDQWNKDSDFWLWKTRSGGVPDEVADEIGLPRSVSYRLATHNDQDDWSFEELANLIEKIL